ncbi:restriction endonuclease subunit S [Bacteroides thetaiotaomicron]|mgnify:CR=1 FL=1|nr:restriction endonuclease subunit S [Bacteroides thetaiotaomicron]MBF7062349.1 restriction endonuclease subunit S [Bacteroides sp. HF-5613]RJU56157.1 restriction endonuclease subunit S [Bacteroides sp. AM30-16]KAB4602074.1 restriction endonuclease subunit S [Bacteroides thetaiotaomicron]KAB4615161.1 restriction endonuclease subunit S [Bacteroides thetaiotaomicron]
MDTKALRQKILDLAIHGKLVPQDPNDEPASVLLERIKAEKERLIKEGKIKRSKKSAKTSDTPHYENVLPKGWCLSTLGEVFTLQAGKNITAKDIKDAVTESHPYKCYGGNGVRGFVALYNREGDFPIIGRQGALCGNINIAKGKFYATEHAVVVESYCDVDLMWAYYILITLNLNQYATATAQPGLSVAVINDVCIPIPPRKEQERISKEIEHWFALIDQIEQGKSDLQTIIKQTKNKILDFAIHGKLVPQDPNDEPAIELLKRINPDFTPCDNGHYTQLPIGWEVVPMQMLCSLTDGKKLDGKEMPNLDVKYLRGERDFKTLTNGRYVAANNLLILVDGENSGEVFRTPIEGYQGSTFKQLHIAENIHTDYLLHVINLHRKSLRENKIGSAIPHLNKKQFKAIEVPVPPYNEQVKIVAAINSAQDRLDTIMENL